MQKIKIIMVIAVLLCLTALAGITVRNVLLLADTFNRSSQNAAKIPSVTNEPDGTDETEHTNVTVNTDEPVSSGASKQAPSVNTGKKSEYQVYSQEKLAGQFETYEDALAFARDREKSVIRLKGQSPWLWDNYPSYEVYTDNESYMAYDTFADAAAYAKAQPKALIQHRKDGAAIWDSTVKLSGLASINAPLINQQPELSRGCEVTSLAMLLAHAGVDVNKMELAENIRKNETPYKIINGSTHFGDPNNGFVGDIYSLYSPGLGVYHKPIHELMTRYLPYRSLDLTGCEFNDLLYFLEAGSPVWVIINSTYAELTPNHFMTWQTESGALQITYKEHSVLITGYDDSFVYFNDPLNRMDKAPIKDFQAAWEQMGRQAVAATPMSTR